MNNEEINQIESYNSLIKRRLEELDEILKKNINPYPYFYDVDSYSKDIISNYDLYEGKDVSIAGRIMTLRKMGKATFFNLMDSKGKIQVYIKRDDIGEMYDLFKLLDIGDIIGIKGFVFKTRTGEISVHTKEFTILSKSIKPIPIAKEVTDEKGNKIIYDQFADKELRYRQRYIDLLVNQNVKDVFILRSKIVKTLRDYLDSFGYLEVETPVLQPLYGGAAARPFITHHNALDMTLYLRIADELYLKRLIVGGFEGVYEISKDFRNEGMDREHNPEFTMLELYVSYKDYIWMMEFVEKMISQITFSLFGNYVLEINNEKINFEPPWKRISLIDSVNELLGINVMTSELHDIYRKCKEMNFELEENLSKGKIIDELFSTYIQPKLIQPTFVYDYPVEISPLAKMHRSNPDVVERFEGFVLGRELCNAFSELNDPLDQKRRFEQQVSMRSAGDEEAHTYDEDYINALEYGMPPTAGLGIGIDRLVMLLTNQSSIRDVIFFPQMKPDK